MAESKPEENWSAKSALKHVYHKVDNKIVSTITRAGKIEKKHTIKHPVIGSFDDKNLEELLGMARNYDTQEFFIFKSHNPKHELGLGYRMTLRAYKTVRDGGVATVKAVYRIGKKR